MSSRAYLIDYNLIQSITRIWNSPLPVGFKTIYGLSHTKHVLILMNAPSSGWEWYAISSTLHSNWVPAKRQWKVGQNILLESRLPIRKIQILVRSCSTWCLNRNVNHVNHEQLINGYCTEIDLISSFHSLSHTLGPPPTFIKCAEQLYIIEICRCASFCIFRLM